MTKQIEVYGRTIKLYRVGAYDNAWCSDRRLALQLERRRRELERQLYGNVTKPGEDHDEDHDEEEDF